MIRIGVPGLEEIVRKLALSGVEWRQTRRAIEMVAEKAAQEWKRIASNPEQNHAKWFGGQYAKSISITSKNLDNLSITIGPKGQGASAARVIETGRDRFDMKPGLLGGPRARSGRKGAYTIIGFQHGMETVEEHGLKDDFSKLKTMDKTGSKTGMNAKGQQVQRNVYSMTSAGYGKRLGAKKGGDTIDDRLKNMVKTRQMVGKNKEKPQDMGLTFRVVSANSADDSWHFPEIKPENVRERLYDSMKAEGFTMMSEAINRDMMEHFTQGINL